MRSRILLDAQGAEGNGTESTAAATAGQDEARGFDHTLAVTHKGDAVAFARAIHEELGREGKKYRDQIRELKARLGKAADVAKAVEQRDQYQAEAASLRKADVVRQAAELHGFRPSVLATLARDAEIEIREEKGKDGTPVKVAVVKGEGDQVTPLVQHAEGHWADFLPALKAEANAPKGSPRPAHSPAVPAVAPAPKTPHRPLVR